MVMMIIVVVVMMVLIFKVFILIIMLERNIFARTLSLALVVIPIWLISVLETALSLISALVSEVLIALEEVGLLGFEDSLIRINEILNFICKIK
jgi:hypothetical protein